MSELYHHGIKGMRWGVRRYQNEDGSLTSVGKKHYQAVDEFNQRRAIKKQREHDLKNMSLLSDEELNSKINRLMKEKQFADLSAQVVTPGRKKARDLINKYGDMAISAGISTLIGVGITKKINKAWEPKYDFEEEVKKETNRVKVKEEAQRRASAAGYHTKNYVNGKAKQS